MKSFGLPAVFILAFIIANVRCDCPEGGCKCGEYCVDSSDKWCNSDIDSLCSCKKGCMVFDSLLMLGETRNLYCNSVSCGNEGVLSIKTSMSWCEPKNLEADVDYPSNWYSDPNCKDYDSELNQINL